MLTLQNCHTRKIGNSNAKKNLARKRQEKKEINLTGMIKKKKESDREGQEDVKKGNKLARISETRNEGKAFPFSLANAVLLPANSSVKCLRL